MNIFTKYKKIIIIIKMKMNNNLNKAKSAKNDEFYTRYEDVEKELLNYKDQFKCKIIYCNCDNPQYSNFYKYLKDNFKYFELKCLISTYYSETDCVYKTVYDGINEIKTQLLGNGDFASLECINILNECDIVITNPPFSLIRIFYQKIKNKQFLFIAPHHVIGYVCIGNELINNKFNFGYTKPKKFISQNCEIKNICNLLWITNLKTQKQYLTVFNKKYYGNETDYPKLDNYDAINCDKTKYIPFDYFYNIAVPLSAIEKLDRNIWELVEIKQCPIVNTKNIYKRIIVKRL